MSNSTIFINGKEVYHRPYGFIGFEIDITPYINFDKNNVFALRLNPEVLSIRWYPGAGIYRNVWLETKNPVQVKHWGTHISTPEKAARGASSNGRLVIQSRKCSLGHKRWSLATSFW